MKILTADISELAEFPAFSAEEIAEFEKIGNMKRRSETMLTRAMVKQLIGGDCRVEHSSDGAPYIPGLKGFLSISHSADKAVVAYSDEKRIGVDIEHWREALRRVIPKFLSEEEIPVYSVSEKLLLRAWTVKEAVYKAMGIDGLSLFAIHLPGNPEDTTATVTTEEETVAVELIYIAENPAITLAVTEPRP